MRIFRTVLLFAALLMLIVGLRQHTRADSGSAPAKKYGPIAWTDSLAQARKTAKREKKIVFVDFYAEWCGPCMEMLHTTYKDKQVAARSKKFVPVLINVDKQPNVATKYGIQGIPTVLFLDGKGSVLRREEGYHDAGEFLKITDAVLSRAAHAK